MALKNPGRLEFDALVLRESDENNGAYIQFPYDTNELFGTKGQVKVNASFDGHCYRGSLANMGGGCHILPLVKAIREKIGKQPGQMVRVTIELDTEPRTVDVPADVQSLLDDNPGAKERFESLSYTHKKEYISWINEAKKPETRARRLEKMVSMLSTATRTAGG